jgi:hypothetical protein
VIFHAWQMYLLLSQEEKEEDVPDEAPVHGRMDGWMVRWLDGWTGKHRRKGTWGNLKFLKRGLIIEIN